MVSTYLELHKKNIRWLFAFPTAVFLLTELVYCTALGIFKADSTFLFLSAALPVATAFFVLVIMIFHIYWLFTLSIQMGRTRKETVGALLGYALLVGVTVTLFAEVLVLLDALITYGLWARLVPGLSISGSWQLIPLWGVGLMALCAPLLGFALAAALHRWGGKAFWLIWALWMLFCLFPNTQQPIEEFFSTQFYILPVAGLLFLIWAFHYLRRAPVK